MRAGDPINLSGYAVKGSRKIQILQHFFFSKFRSSYSFWNYWSAYASGYVDVYLAGSQTAALPVGEFVYDIEKYPTEPQIQKELSIKY